jgi:hypothetical protein
MAKVVLNYDPFNDPPINNIWQQIVAGGGSLNETTSLRFHAPTVAGVAALVLKTPLDRTKSRFESFKWAHDGGSNCFSLHIYYDTSLPTTQVDTTEFATKRSIAVFTEVGEIKFQHFNNLGQERRWDVPSQTWKSGAQVGIPFVVGTTYRTEFENDEINERWRINLYDADDNIIEQSDWVLWVDTRIPAGDPYVIYGDLRFQVVTCDMRGFEFVESTIIEVTVIEMGRGITRNMGRSMNRSLN